MHINITIKKLYVAYLTHTLVSLLLLLSFRKDINTFYHVWKKQHVQNKGIMMEYNIFVKIPYLFLLKSVMKLISFSFFHFIWVV
jgi:hypothetical protein